MKNLLGALGIAFAACGDPSLPCSRPPYADLSRWFTTGASFTYDCGVAVEASLVTDPAAAGLVRGEWFEEEAGDDAWVEARVDLDGAGRLDLELFGERPIASTSTGASGQIRIIGRRPGQCAVSFLAFASSPGFKWSVSRVSLRSVSSVQ